MGGGGVDAKRFALWRLRPSRLFELHPHFGTSEDAQPQQGCRLRPRFGFYTTQGIAACFGV